MIRTKLIIALLLVTSFTSLSQTTRKKLEISREALTLIKKDLQICDSLAVAYEAQKKTLLALVDRNVILFNKIESNNKKAELWRGQIKKQEGEIVKLQKRKKNSLIWLGAGALAGLITGVYISN